MIEINASRMNPEAERAYREAQNASQGEGNEMTPGAQWYEEFKARWREGDDEYHRNVLGYMLDEINTLEEKGEDVTAAKGVYDREMMVQDTWEGIKSQDNEPSSLDGLLQTAGREEVSNYFLLREVLGANDQSQEAYDELYRQMLENRAKSAQLLAHEADDFNKHQ